MEKFTLDTDFSTLSGSQTNDWILGFREMTRKAFAESDDRSRLLGNLLIMEQYVHTVCQGLAANDEQPSDTLLHAMDLLWDYLEGRIVLADFQDFANNLFASVAHNNIGEDLTDTQAEFYSEHFSDRELSSCEWLGIEWCSILLLQLVANEGGRVDFDELDIKEQPIDFVEVEEMLSILEDASIEFTNTPCPSSMAKDLMQAEEQVHQTPVFRGIIDHIRNSLKAALTAAPDQFPALRKEYQQYTIIPKKYAVDLIEY